MRGLLELHRFLMLSVCWTYLHTERGAEDEAVGVREEHGEHTDKPQHAASVAVSRLVRQVVGDQ